jgi:uncharacterized protein YjbJ (UPF0337 family)
VHGSRSANCTAPTAFLAGSNRPEGQNRRFPARGCQGKGLSLRGTAFAFASRNTRERDAMNTLQAKGNWNIAKGKLKQKFANLTDDDLRFEDGKEDELIGRIQKRTGQTKEAIEKASGDCCSDQP